MELSLSELRGAVETQCRRRNCAYALLFGSVARGEARLYSDVDVAVKFRERLSPVEYAMEAADIALCPRRSWGSASTWWPSMPLTPSSSTRPSAVGFYFTARTSMSTWTTS